MCVCVFGHSKVSKVVNVEEFGPGCSARRWRSLDSPFTREACNQSSIASCNCLILFEEQLLRRSYTAGLQWPGAEMHRKLPPIWWNGCIKIQEKICP